MFLHQLIIKSQHMGSSVEQVSTEIPKHFPWWRQKQLLVNHKTFGYTIVTWVVALETWPVDLHDFSSQRIIESSTQGHIWIMTQTCCNARPSVFLWTRKKPASCYNQSRSLCCRQQVELVSSACLLFFFLSTLCHQFCSYFFKDRVCKSSQRLEGVRFEDCRVLSRLF